MTGDDPEPGFRRRPLALGTLGARLDSRPTRQHPGAAACGCRRGARRRLTPLRWFLHRCGDAIPLTQLFNLSRAVVLEAEGRFHWYPANDFGWKPRLEADLPQLMFVHQLAKDLRAVRRRGRRLTLTKRRAALTTNPALLWGATVEVLAEDDGFGGDLTETVLGVLLGSGSAGTTDRELDFIAGDVLRRRWRVVNGGLGAGARR